MSEESRLSLVAKFQAIVDFCADMIRAESDPEERAYWARRLSWAESRLAKVN